MTETENAIPPEINIGEQPLVKDISRQPVSMGEFYFTETEGKRKNYLVRKAGDIAPRRILSFGDKDRPGISYSHEKITEYQLRREVVAMRIYQELGLDVPNMKLITLDGRLALRADDLGAVRRVDLPSASMNEAQRAQVKEYYIASRLLNNPGFVLSFAERASGQLVLTDALPRSPDDAPGIFYSPANPLLRNYVDTKKFENAFGLEINSQDEIEQSFHLRIEGLSSQRIAEIVLEAGLTVEEAKPLLKQLLAGKEATLKMLTYLNKNEATVNTPEWDKLDDVLAQSEGNRQFRILADHAQNTTKVIESVKRTIDLIIDGNMDENQQPAGSIETDFTQEANRLLEIKKSLELKKRALPRPVYHIMGFAALEKKLADQTKALADRLGLYADRQVEYIWKGLVEVLEGESVHDLVNYLSPTKKQVETIANLGRIIAREDVRPSISSKNYDLFINYLFPSIMRRRLDFKRLCEDRSKTLVSHLSVPKSIRSSLREGAIESSLSQSQNGKKPAVNSPAGLQGPLAQLAFAIDGAALGYGGLDREGVQIIETDRSVGFVAPYSSVVSGHKFVEHPCSGLGIRDELHIFDPQYSDTNIVGMQINVDDMWLFVPAQDRQEWEKFLATPKEQKGAGKSQDWVLSHLRSYPDYVDLDTFIRYFTNTESLGSVATSLGIFITNGEEITVHKGNKKQKAFSWKSLDA